MKSGQSAAPGGMPGEAASHRPTGVSILLCGAPAENARAALATPGDSTQILSVPGIVHPVDLCKALEEAKFERIVVADSSFEAAEVPSLASLADGRSLVVATTRVADGSFGRRTTAAALGVFTRVLLGVPSAGLLLGAKADLLATLPDAGGPSLIAEWVTRARRTGTKITEVRLDRPRSDSNLPTIAGAVRAANHLLRFWWDGLLHAEPEEPQLAGRRGFLAAVAGLLLLCGMLLYTNLSHPLVEPDEGRHAEIPREMLATGNWLVPHFNNEPYYDKPPLFYWLCATSYSAFGVSERSARLVPATVTTLLVLSLFVWARRRFGTRPAFLGAAVFAMSPGPVIVGRFVVLDSLLDLLVAGSLMMAFEAVRTGRLRPGWWIASAVCCGLGLLAKGPVSLALTVPPLAAFAWLDRRAVWPKVRHWAVYGLVAVAVAAPWFAAVIARDPEYARYFFWDHNIARFLAGANHPKPIWFYAPVLLLGALPWSLLLAPLVPFLLGRSERLRALRPRGTGFLMLWAGWCLSFFTVSNGKLPTYVLPSVPPLSLLIGLYLDRLLFSNAVLPLAGFARRFVPRYGASALCWGGLIAGIVLPLLQIATWQAVAPALAFWAACLLALGVTWWRITPRPSYVALGVIAFAGVLDATHGVLPRWAEKRSLFSAASPLDAALKNPAIAVGCWGSEWGSIPFSLRRNDVTNFEHGHVERAKQFLLDHDRMYLLLKSDFEVSEVTAHLPRGKTLTHLADIGNRRFGAPGFARVFLVEPTQRIPSEIASRWFSLASQGDPSRL